MIVMSGEMKKDGKESAHWLVATGLQLLDPENRIDGLESDVRTKFRSLVLTIAMLGFGKIHVVSGRRTYDEQSALWGRGRRKMDCARVGINEIHASPDESIVTWTLPKWSKHVEGRAIDIDVSEYEAGSYEILGHAARSVGVKWGGTWKVRDYGHFEC